MFDPRTNLPARAAVFVGGGILLFTVVVAWFSGVNHQRQLHQQLGSSFETLAFQVSDKIERTIYTRYRELQFASALFGQATTPDQRRRIVEQLQVAAPDFAWIGYADATGQVVAATAGIFEGTPADKQEWFLSAQNGPFIGPPREHSELALLVPETDTEAQRRFLVLAVPVVGPNGRPGGVIGAYVHWSWARDAQLSVVPGSARQQRLGVTLYSAAGEVFLDSGGSGWNVPLAAPTLPNSRGSMTERTDTGTTYLTGYVQSRGYREYRGLRWITAVRQPVDLAFAPVDALRRAIVGVGMLLAAGLGAVAWTFAWRHARRINLITAAAGRIHEGDVLAVIPPPQGDAELDRMCRTVGSLVEDLRPKPDPTPDVGPLTRPAYSPVERMQRSV